MTAAAQSDEATTRVIRILAFAFGVGSLVFGVLSLQAIQSQFASFELWWTVPALTATFGIPFAMALVARWGSMTLIRSLAGATAIGYYLAMLTLWPALIGGHLATSPATPWLLEVTVIGTTAAALAWRPWAVWTYMGIIAVLIALDRILAGGRDLVQFAAEDALYTLLFASIFSTLALICIRAGRALDVTLRSAQREATAAAAEKARSQERARMERLMHDSVLSTLLTAANEGDAFAEAAAVQARRTLAQLDLLSDPPRIPDLVRAEDFVWLQQATTTEVSPDAYFSYELDDPDARIPGEVSHVIAEALAEALRNSVRHAGRPGAVTNRAVHVVVTGRLVQVIALDDGRGFDPSTVPSTRLGIAVGISGRLHQVDGGRAQVTSSTGNGTRVVLEWRPR